MFSIFGDECHGLMIFCLAILQKIAVAVVVILYGLHLSDCFLVVCKLTRF